MIHRNEKVHKWFIRFAWAGIISAIAILLLVAYWLFIPYTIVHVKQPFEVLNQNNEVAVGDDLLLKVELEVVADYRPAFAPIIVCKSGNLVTLTNNLPDDIPMGKYTFEALPVEIAPKFTIGDTCQYVAVLQWQVNPLRMIEETYHSEFFTITEGSR